MKKIAALLSLSILGGCIYAGSYNFLPGRNKIFTFWQTEKIHYYDKAFDEEYLIKTDTVSETSELAKDIALVVEVDGVIAESKTYQVNFYGRETLRVNKNGVLSSSYSPLYIKTTDHFNAIGEVELNEQKYMLVRQGKSNDILLINGEGEIYEHIGRIVDDRLALIDVKFFVEPEDVRISPVITTRLEQTTATKGYELVYNGIVDNQISFKYITFGKNGETETETFTFQTEQQNVKIKGFKLGIIAADAEKLEYIIF